MNRTLAPLGRRLADVTGRRALGAYFVLTCADEEGPRPQAGQFYMLAAAERWGGGEDERPFLPRAFSVARVNGDELEFMLEDVGPGTRRLAELREGDGLWLLGPLGKPFAPAGDGKRPVLVGGGIGTAPLVILADTLEDPLVLLGFRGAEHAHGAELLPGAQIATDDGSVGHHGLVTDLLDFVLQSSGVRTSGRRYPDIELLACGPPLMLEAVRSLAERRGLRAQLALEAGMACGYGACFGCVVPTRDGYVRLCVDGPVLEASQLEAVHAH
ncbi:MAG: dihydroorotate dehydrogenase electron transfer subunit [Solirubrobacteraceae bacterium]